MSEENVEIVRDQYTATSEQDFERAMSAWADDVELVVPRSEHILAAGSFRGRDEVAAWFADWFGTFQPGYHFEVEEARDLGPDMVLIVTTHHGRGRASGVEVRWQTSQIFRLEEGMVCRMEIYDNREDALEAAGLSDEPLI